MNFQLLHQHAAPSNNLFHLCMEQLLHNVIPLLNYCLLWDSLGWESTCASLLLQWWCIVHLNSASKISGRVFGQYNRNKLHSMPYTSSMLYKKPSLATARRPNISLNKRLKKKKKTGPTSQQVHYSVALWPEIKWSYLMYCKMLTIYFIQRLFYIIANGRRQPLSWELQVTPIVPSP